MIRLSQAQKVAIAGATFAFILIALMTSGSSHTAPAVSDYIDVGDQTFKWKNAPQFYVCTKEQLELVKEETKLCKDTTNYLGEYCFSQAKVSRCNITPEGQRLMQTFIDVRGVE